MEANAGAALNNSNNTQEETNPALGKVVFMNSTSEPTGQDDIGAAPSANTTDSHDDAANDDAENDDVVYDGDNQLLTF